MGKKRSTTVRTMVQSDLTGEPALISVTTRKSGPAGLTISGLNEVATRETMVIAKSVLGPIGPMTVKVSGPTGGARSYALALVVAIMAHTQGVAVPPDMVIVGDLSIGGEARAACGLIAQLRGAAARGYRAIVPAAHGAEAALVPGISVCCVETAQQALAALQNWPDSVPISAGSDLDRSFDLPPPEIREALRDRAQAAASLLLVGGSDRLRLQCARYVSDVVLPEFPSLQGDRGVAAALDAATVASIAGLMPSRIVPRFRAPHHSVSVAGMMGYAGRPGEISLAHGGVLYLEHVGEFRPGILDDVMLARKAGVVQVSAHTYPSECFVVASDARCACGSGRYRSAKCDCPPGVLERYQESLRLLSLTFGEPVDLDALAS